MIVGFYLPGRGGLRAAAQEAAQAGAAKAGAAVAPNTFVRIAPDNSVTVLAKHIEMGQGAHTGLATILAEELDADWGQVRVEAAPADATRYNNLAFGQIQGTGGSTAMANSWEQMRKAGATARAMLVAAAAAEWKVPGGGDRRGEGRRLARRLESPRHVRRARDEGRGDRAAGAVKSR